MEPKPTETIYEAIDRAKELLKAIRQENTKNYQYWVTGHQGDYTAEINKVS